MNYQAECKKARWIFYKMCFSAKFWPCW